MRSDLAPAGTAPGATHSLDPLGLGGAVVKYSPSQPRDERGRWTAYRGIHGDTIEESHARARASMAGRMSNGQDGRGIYLTSAPSVARTYSGGMEINGVVLRARYKPGAKVLTHAAYLDAVRQAKEYGDDLGKTLPADYARQRGFDIYESFSNNIVVVNPDAIEWDPTIYDAEDWEEVLKYSPSQSRAPKGSPNGGQWIDEGSAGTLDLKGDFNPGGFDGATTYSSAGGAARGGPEERIIDDYLTVSGVDNDTVAAVRDAFEGTWGGLRSVVTDISATSDGGNIHVNGRITDEKGEQVGDFTRDIFPETKEVSHQSLFMLPAVQGRGFAKGFLSQSEAHYRAQGIERVLVHAVDVGGYAWARAGFDFVEFGPNGNHQRGNPPASVIAKLEEVATYTQYLQYPRAERSAAIAPYVDHSLAAQGMLDRIKTGQHVSAYEIASLGADGPRFEPNVHTLSKGDSIGQYIMLGEEWNGVKELNSSMAIAKAAATVHLDDLTDEDWEWIERACSERPVLKYAPGQPRDENGRWTDGASSSGTPGKPDWSPTMTRDDAEHWAADSVIQDVLTHTTGRERLSYVTRLEEGGHMEWVGGAPKDGGHWETAGKPAGILVDGLRPGSSGVFGDGIYLGAEPLVGREEETGDWYDGVAELVDRQAEGYAYGADRVTAPTLRVKVDVRNPYVHVVTGSAWDHTENIAAELAEQHGRSLDLSEGLAAMLQNLGHDALVIKHPGEFEWNVGGDQVVIWDKTKVTVLVDESGQPEDYRFRKYSPQQPRDDRGRWTNSGSTHPSRGPGGHDLSDDQRDSMTLNEQIAWARNPARKYPIGKVVGGDLSSGDFRIEHDPDRRFAELWQRNYEGYSTVREAALNVLAGKDPLDGFDIDNVLDRYNSGQMDDPSAATHELRRRASFYSGFLVSQQGYGRADLKQDISSAGRWLADGLREAKPGEHPSFDALFRGTSMPTSQLNLWRKQPGARFTLGPTATSNDSGTAARYRRGDVNGRSAVDVTSGAIADFDMRTTFHFAHTTRRFSLDDHSDWASTHPEQIIAGTFEVERVDFTSSDGAHVYVKPVEQP